MSLEILFYHVMVWGTPKLITHIPLFTSMASTQPYMFINDCIIISSENNSVLWETTINRNSAKRIVKNK